MYVTPREAQKSHTINVGLLIVHDTKEAQKEAYNTAAGYLLYVTPKCDTLIAASVMAALVMFSKSD